MNPFSPEPLSRKDIDVSASSQRIPLTDGPGPHDIRVHNAGTAEVFVEFGGSTVTADVDKSQSYGPGVHEIVRPRYNKGPLYVAAIAAGSTGKVHFTPGTGI